MAVKDWEFINSARRDVESVANALEHLEAELKDGFGDPPLSATQIRESLAAIDSALRNAGL